MRFARALKQDSLRFGYLWLLSVFIIFEIFWSTNGQFGGQSWSIIDSTTLNSDSVRSNTIFFMSKLRSFEAESILGFLWSTNGQMVGRGGRLFVFEERFRFSGSEYPFFHVQVAFL